MKKLLFLLLLPLSLFAQTPDATIKTNTNNLIRNATTVTRANHSLINDQITDSKESRISAFVATGTDTYVVSIPFVTSYQLGLTVRVQFTNANTTTSTININSLGAKTLKKAVSTDVVAGDIIANESKVLWYDGTNFQVFGASGGGGSGTVTNVSALTLGTTGTDLSSSVANPTTTPVITLNVPTASAANRGALSSTDWTTFNNKAKLWGSITGTLSSQTDLQTALNNKWSLSVSNVLENSNDTDGSSLYSYGFNNVTQFYVTSDNTSFQVNPTSTYLNATNAGGTQNVNIDLATTVGGLKITDARTVATGIQYNTDYSANYTSRSLIDQGYALATFAPISGGAYWRLASGGTLTGANVIASTGTNNITINQTALGAGNGLVINSSSTDAASNTQTAFRVNQTGANATASQTTYSGFFSNTKTGTTNTNIAGYFEASGGTTNIAIQIGAGKLLTSSSSTLAAVNIGSVAGTPSTLTNGDLWQNSTSGNLMVVSGGTGYNIPRILSGSQAVGRVVIHGSNSSNSEFTELSTFTYNTNSGLVVAATAASSGSNPLTVFTGAAHINQTASELIDINYNLNRTVQFTGSTGFATQRAYLIQAPTYAFVSATGTITTAATLAVSGAPTAGTNAAITNPLAFWTQAGSVRFDAPSSVFIANASVDTPTASTRLDLRGLGTATNKTFRTATSANTQTFEILDNANINALPISGSIMTLGGGATASELRFLEPSGSGTNYVGFKAPALAGNIIFTLPPAFVAGGVPTDVAGDGVLTMVVPSVYTDEQAQDAIGAMVDASLTYVDGTPLLQRAALTGAITATAGSNATVLGSFTIAALSTAISDANISGTNTGDQTITLTGGVTGSGTGSFAATVITNANLTGGVTSVGNAATVITNANLTGIVTSTGNATAIADGAVALAKLANGTAGQIPTWSAGGVITTVATGTSGHVLTSNGVGAAPTFQAVSGGSGLTFAQTSALLVIGY